MLNKEIIDKKLKAELELFKMYSIFLIAISTGFTGILYKIFDINNNYNSVFLLFLSIIAFIILLTAFRFVIRSHNKIKMLTKNTIK